MSYLNASFQNFNVVGEIELTIPEDSAFQRMLVSLSKLSRTLVYHTLYMFILTGGQTQFEGKLPEGAKLRDIRKIDPEEGIIILTIEIPIRLEKSEQKKISDLQVLSDYTIMPSSDDVHFSLDIMDVLPKIIRALVLASHWDETRSETKGEKK